MLRRFTRDEYHRMGDAGLFEQERVELVRGVVFRVSAMRSPHSYCVRRLNDLISPQVRGRAAVFVQLPLAAGHHSEPEPDYALCPPGDYLDDHPHQAWLVVEVAESSLAFDRETKGSLYAEMGVPQYWSVNLVDGLIEVHTAPVDGGYSQVAIARRGDVLSMVALPDVQVAVSAVLPPR